MNTLLKRRRIMMMGNVVRLPEGYTELQYVECNGNQYLSTGLVPTPNYIVEGSFLLKSNSTSVFGAYYYSMSSIGGTRRYQSDYSCQQENASSLTWNCYYYSGSSMPTGRYVNTSISTNTWYKFTFSKSSVKLNNVTTSYSQFSPAPSSFISGLPSLIIGGLNDEGLGGNGPTPGFVGYLGEFLIYENTTLLKDYVPAMNSTGKIGFYDLVNDSFHESGSGTAFIAGPEL